MLIAMIVVSVVLMVISLSMGILSISENQIGLYQSRAAVTFINAEGCVDEALLSLSRNNAYTGGSVFGMESTNCVAVVSGVGASRTVDVTATNGQYVRRISVGVNLSPFSITSWSEQ